MATIDGFDWGACATSLGVAGAAGWSLACVGEARTVLAASTVKITRRTAADELLFMIRVPSTS